MCLYFKFTAKSNSEGILKIGKHLTMMSCFLTRSVFLTCQQALEFLMG